MLDLSDFALKPVDVPLDDGTRIVLRPFNVGALQALGDSGCTEEDDIWGFLTEFVRALGVRPGEGDTLDQQYETGTPLESEEVLLRLTSDDLERVAEQYLAEQRGLFSGDEDDEHAQQPAPQRLRALVKHEIDEWRESAQRIAKTFTSGIRLKPETLKVLQHGATVSSLFQDQLNRLDKMAAQAARIEPLEMKIPEIPQPPPNPAYETNEILEAAVKELGIMRQAMVAQARRIDSAANDTQTLVAQSVGATQHSENTLRIAIISLVASVVLSAAAVGVGVWSNISTGAQLDAVITELQSLGDGQPDAVQPEPELPAPSRPDAPVESAPAPGEAGADTEAPAARPEAQPSQQKTEPASLPAAPEESPVSPPTAPPAPEVPSR